MAEAILQLEEVTKRFDRTLAADRLSLTVHRGEFFTFLGPSGSGKSTILPMIAGLERPDAGRILIAGRDAEGGPPWRRNLGDRNTTRLNPSPSQSSYAASCL